MSIFWEPAPGGARKGWIADTSAGRYLVKRREPRGPWIATLNGARVMLAEVHIWPNAESAMQAINRSHV